jgi:hypothetical protein
LRERRAGGILAGMRPLARGRSRRLGARLLPVVLVLAAGCGDGVGRFVADHTRQGG